VCTAIEQSGQLCCRWVLVLRLLRTSEQLYAAFALGHQTFKQRGIQTVQILQRVHHAKRGPHVEVERAMSERSEIYQQDAPWASCSAIAVFTATVVPPAPPLEFITVKMPGAAGGGTALAARCSKASERLNQAL